MKTLYLDKDQELTLIKMYQETQDEPALQLLIKSQLNYIYKIVNKVNKSFRQTVEMEDMIQTAILGFTIGVKRFDVESGNRLMTYAQFRIMAELFNIYANTMPVHIPVHLLREVVWRTDKQMAEQKNRIHERVAKALALTRTYDTVESEDVVLKPSEFATAVDVTYQLFEKFHISDDTHEALAELSPLARQVLWLRAGLDMGGRYTLPEIAEELDLSHEQVNLELKRARRRLKMNPAINRLKETA